MWENILNYFQPDPYVDKHFYLPSLGTVCLICLTYLFIVLWAGRNFMSNRSPYNVKSVLLIYNAFIVSFITYIVYLIYSAENSLTVTFYPGTYYDLNQKARHQYCKINWLFFISKVLELIDTFLFISRKKFNQVSNLHVFHHVIVVIFTYFFLKYEPGAHIFGIFLNSAVHIIMYTYYFIAALGPQFQKYIWWKKYLTTLQMIQFGMMISLALLVPFIDRSPNKPILFPELFLGATFLVLFLNFYKKTYTANEKRTT